MQLCPENPVVPAKKVHIDVDYALETLTGRRKKQPGDDVIRQAYLTIILARTLPLLKLIEKPTPGDGDLIYRTVSYISAHFTEEDLSLTGMARDLYISPFALSRVFSGTFHMNFSRYVNEMRIDYAKHLLAYTDQSVTEIFENAGFGRQRTFNRAFREYVHMTPKEFRDANQIQPS
jgi:AraC-like DNA-binding protein